MRVATSSEMLTIEKQAEVQFGLTVSLLMERAGQAVAETAQNILPDPGNVLIVCGKGNNGGDGFVAARLLSNLGYNVTVFSLASRDDFSTVARDAYDNLPPKVTLIAEPNVNRLDQEIIKADLIIDAIFGFSLKGAVRGAAVDVIDRINESQKLVLSVDLPSGLEADTGKAHGRVVVANVTVTFTAPKVGMLLYPGSEYTGEFVVADIGIPQSLVNEYSGFRHLENMDVYDLLPGRDIEAHKKAVGQVLVIAGSRGMPGAAALAGRAAYKMGAGLVGFAPPAGITSVLNSTLIEAVAYPQIETSTGALALDAYDSLMRLSEEYDVVIIGPGLSLDDETIELTQRLIATIEKPMVIDASALTAIADTTEVLNSRHAGTVITPHPGEMARLFKTSVKEITNDSPGFSRRASEEFGVVAVLKSARTIISKNGESTINTTGNPGLATGGTGDVLTGFIAALIGQGLDPYNAASVAAYLHGLSADIAVEDISAYCLMASDVIDYLPDAIRCIL